MCVYNCTYKHRPSIFRRYLKKTIFCFHCFSGVRKRREGKSRKSKNFIMHRFRKNNWVVQSRCSSIIPLIEEFFNQRYNTYRLIRKALPYLTNQTFKIPNTKNHLKQYGTRICCYLQQNYINTYLPFVWLNKKNWPLELKTWSLYIILPWMYYITYLLAEMLQFN